MSVTVPGAVVGRVVGRVLLELLVVGELVVGELVVGELGSEVVVVLGLVVVLVCGPEADVPWLQDVITLLIAGVQFLLVRARHSRLWGGRDLHQDAAWTHLKQSVRTLALQVMPPR